MQALLGIFFHITGGVAAGSFYMPYQKVEGWKWESYWIVGGLFSWLLVPFLLTWATVPDFLAIIAASPIKVLYSVFVFGVLWGIGGLTFGLGLRYLGMSLGMSVMLGLSLAIGSLLPMIYYQIYPVVGKTGIGQMLTSSSGLIVLLGIALSLIGISICGYAGIQKEKQFSTDDLKVSEFDFKKGLLVAILSGFLSACFNFGIEAGKPLAEEAVNRGFNPLFQNNVTFVVLLWGGLLTNAIWCVYLNIKNNSYGDYTNSKLPLTSNYLLCGLAGAMWFLQFFFYGMGESKLGNGASSWVLHMVAIILVGNFWGFVLREWKGVDKRTSTLIYAGIAVLLLSVSVIGWGNSL